MNPLIKLTPDKSHEQKQADVIKVVIVSVVAIIDLRRLRRAVPASSRSRSTRREPVGLRRRRRPSSTSAATSLRACERPFVIAEDVLIKVADGEVTNLRQAAAAKAALDATEDRQATITMNKCRDADKVKAAKLDAGIKAVDEASQTELTKDNVQGYLDTIGDGLGRVVRAATPRCRRAGARSRAPAPPRPATSAAGRRTPRPAGVPRPRGSSETRASGASRVAVAPSSSNRAVIACLLRRTDVLPHDGMPDHRRHTGREAQRGRACPGPAPRRARRRHRGGEDEGTAQAGEPASAGRATRRTPGAPGRPASPRPRGRRPSPGARRSRAGRTRRAAAASARATARASSTGEPGRPDPAPAGQRPPACGPRAGSARRSRRSRRGGSAARTAPARAAARRSARPRGRPRSSGERSARPARISGSRGSGPSGTPPTPAPEWNGSVAEPDDARVDTGRAPGPRPPSATRCTAPNSRSARAAGTGSSSWPANTSATGPPVARSDAAAVHQDRVDRRAQRAAGHPVPAQVRDQTVARPRPGRGSP